MIKWWRKKKQIKKTHWTKFTSIVKKLDPVLEVLDSGENVPLQYMEKKTSSEFFRKSLLCHTCGLGYIKSLGVVFKLTDTWYN